MQVSVIMPTYNHEKYVAAAIDSVLRQEVDYELLVMDDGSTDGTANAAYQALSRSGGKGRFLGSAGHRGACAVINDLLDAAQGEYVALLNSDDLFHERKLALQLAWMKAHPEVAACFTNVDFIGEDGEPLCGGAGTFDCFTTRNRPRTEWLKTFFYEGNCLCHPTILARRDRYTLRFDRRLCKLPDLDLWVRLCAKEQIAVLPDRLLQFRVRQDSRNASAKTPETMNLIAQETPIILDRFLDLDEADCRAVFGAQGSRAMRRFLIYREGLKLSPAAQQWALRGMYSLLDDPIARGELSVAGFDDCALFALAAQCDPYGMLPVRARLYYASPRDVQRNAEAPFCEERALSAGALRGAFSLSFPLLLSVSSLRFDPAEQPCRVQLSTARLRFSSGKTADLLPLLTHNGKAQGGTVQFDHADPFFLVRLPASCHPVCAEFSGWIELL